MARTIEPRWAQDAAGGGLLGGIAFMIFAMIAGLLIDGAHGSTLPFRLTGATVLGEQSLRPDYPIVFAFVVGGIVHAFLSVLFAVLFVSLIQPTSTIRSTNGLLVKSSVYGLTLWLLNYYVLAPLFGWPWFAETNPLVAFLAHSFFYGWMLGMHLSRHATVLDELPDSSAERAARSTAGTPEFTTGSRNGKRHGS